MNTSSLWIPFLLAAPAAAAGSFDARLVPAEAPWVVHVDLEALSRCALLDALHAQGLRPENDLGLDQLERDSGLDPFDDLASLTFYGAGARGEGSVCVAVGASRALASAWARESERGARAVQVEGVGALQAGGGAQARFLALLAETPGEPRVALVAPSEAALRSALLVVWGDAPTLASPRAGAQPPSPAGAPRARPAPIQARPSAGSLVFAASAPVAGFEENAAFLDRALGLLDELAGLGEDEELALGLGTRALEFELCETRGELQVRLALEARDAGRAAELERLLRAAVSRAPVPADSPQVANRLAQLLAALRLEALGSRLVARYSYSARRFVQDVGFVEEARGLRPGR
jgi:hypothetical protein